MIKSKAKPIKRKFDIKLQKYLFQIHYRLLEKIQYFGGMIFIEHLECLDGQSYAELRMHLEIMKRYGLLNFLKIHNQNLIQLTTFTTTKLKSHDFKKPTLAHTTVLRHAYCGEILSSMIKEFEEERKYFLTLVETRSTFFNINREDDSNKWNKLLRLKKKNAYIFFNREREMQVYFLDLYSSSTTAHRIATRIYEIYTYLQAENLLMYETDSVDKVSFKICVESCDRKIFLETSQSSKIINSYFLKKHLSYDNFDIEIISYNLEGRYFANNRF